MAVLLSASVGLAVPVPLGSTAAMVAALRQMMAMVVVVEAALVARMVRVAMAALSHLQKLVVVVAATAVVRPARE